MLGYAKGEHPGATWHKADFQCHTPRDRKWSGSPTLPGGQPGFEEARRAWAADFINACKARKLRAVAITDHHDVCFIRYIREAARSDDQITVFAGVEVTCSDNAQLLAIFDPACSEQTLNKFLIGLKNIQPSHDHETQTCAIHCTNMTVAELFDYVAGDHYLRDNCLLLPHFSNEDAHKSLNDKGFSWRFSQLPCDGVYIEVPFQQLDKTTLEKIQGKKQEWGTRRRAVLATGDNRFASWDRLGRHDCWVKLGEPTLEALRQALLADEARITHDEPVEPSERIEELRFKSTLTGEDTIRIVFNPGLNTFIGGRGAGKSTILEFLRFALARTSTDTRLPSKESRDGSDGRDAAIVNEMLVDGYVEVDLYRAGVRETWRRDLQTRSVIVVTEASGVIQTLNLDQAQRRFRARAFAQKELSTTMSDYAQAAEQITGIAAAEEVEKRRAIEEEIQAAKRAIATALRQVSAHWQTTLARNHALAKVHDVSMQLQALSSQLEKDGVSPAALQTIESQPAHARASAYLSSIVERIQTDRAELQSRRIAFEKDDFVQLLGTCEFPEVIQLQAQYAAMRTEAQTKIAEIERAIESFEENLVNIEQKLKNRIDAFKVAYQLAMDEQSKHKGALDENTRLSQELEFSETSLAKAVQQNNATLGAVQALSTARASLAHLLNQKRTVLKEAAEKVAINSSGVLMAKAKRDACPEECIAAMCRMMEGSRVQDPEQRCKDWLATSLERDAASWETFTDGLLALYEQKVMTGAPNEPSAEVVGLIRELFFAGTVTLTQNQVRRIYTLLDDDAVSGALAAARKDQIILTYMDERRALPFEKASPGQQASALLELLLRQAAGTLIIDQPEDDLDNRVVMRIVELVRTSKNNRQLIFATHNPNIVVNGDSDKVITLSSGSSSSNPYLDSVRIAVQNDGAIESENVRTSITHVMEGGQEAFDLRGRKYRFDRIGVA